MLFRAPAYKLDRVLSAYRHHEGQRDKQTAEILSSFRRMMRESPEIQASSWRVRRAARAGGRMLTQTYNPRSGWYQTSQIWLALLTYPPSIRGLVRPRLLLPPSYLRTGWRRVAGLTRRLRWTGR
jgi:hypothetical protein